MNASRGFDSDCPPLRPLHASSTLSGKPTPGGNAKLELILVPVHGQCMKWFGKSWLIDGNCQAHVRE